MYVDATRFEGALAVEARAARLGFLIAPNRSPAPCGDGVTDDGKGRRAVRMSVTLRCSSSRMSGRTTSRSRSEPCRMCAPGAGASGALARHARGSAEPAGHVRDGWLYVRRT